MEVALVILDGWGLGNHNRLNAIAAADTSTFERCKQNGAVGQLRAHGRSVGLPSGQMGNSEVGHLTIGAGRVVKQAYTRINEAIEANTLAEKPAIQEVLEFVKEHDSRLHLLGLASDGGVHADHRHLHALIEIANTHDIDAVTHA
ncbi:MAG: 2,3-bisphosphoglycerate-independent phosphoglycerate mutase, partial [Halobacteriaceae archaeon]